MTVHVYEHEDGRSTFGTTAGTEMDLVLAASPAWHLADQQDDGEDATPSDGLEELSRTDLNARALQAGIKEPEKLPNKQAVIDAIRGESSGDGDE